MSATLVGRQAERRAITTFLARVRAGAGGVLTVRGPAGIGKTSLCRWLVDQAAESYAVAWVTCVAEEAAPPFWPWDRLANSLALSGPASARVANSGAGRAQRVEQFSAFTSSLLEASRGRPVVLVIDDAQWLDSSSAHLLEFLVGHLSGEPVGIVLAVRTGDDDAGVNRLAAPVERSTTIELAGMAPQELGQLAAEFGGHELSASQAAELAAVSGGNPFLALALSDADLESDHPTPSVRVLVRRRLAPLTEPCRRLLDVVAVSEPDAYAWLCADVQDSGTEQVLRAAQEASAIGLVSVSPGAVISFQHPLLRETVLDEMALARRLHLHRAIGAQLAARRRDDPTVPLAAVARHLVAAMGVGSAAEAASLAAECGDEAMLHLAYESAAQWYGRAVDATRLAGDGPALPALLLRHGHALECAGHAGPARAAYVESVAVARRLADDVGLARAALAVGSASGFEITLFDDEQLALLAEALVRIGDRDPALRARLLARHSVATTLRLPASERQSAAQEALTLARASGDTAAEIDAMAALCDAIAGPDGVEDRLELTDRMLRRARELDDVPRELLALRMRIVAWLECGELAKADAEIGHFDVTAQRLRQPVYGWYVPLWRAMQRWLAADAPSALRLLDEAEALGAEAGSANAEVLVLTSRFFGMVDSGRADEVPIPTADGISALDASVAPWWTVSLAYAHAARDQLDEVRDLLQRARSGLATLPVDSEYLATLVQAAAAAVLGGDAATARVVYDCLLPHRGRMAIEGIGAYCHGSVERQLAALAAMLGDPAAASSHAARAEAVHRQRNIALPMSLLGAPSRYDIAVSAEVGVFRRDGEIWLVGWSASQSPLRDSKGMLDIARLLARPGRDIAAVDLLGPIPAGVTSAGDVVLDEQARRSYEQRVRALQEEIEEAEDYGDLERLRRAEDERDQLLAALAEAFGLRGRPRRLGDPAERARSAVTHRVRDAIRRISTQQPELGDHLRRSIVTGLLCRYDPITPVQWRL